MRQRPSPFLDDLPAELVRHATPETALEPADRESVADFMAQWRASVTG